MTDEFSNVMGSMCILLQLKKKVAHAKYLWSLFILTQLQNNEFYSNLKVFGVSYYIDS